MAGFQPISIATEAFIKLQVAYATLAPALVRKSPDGKYKKHEFYTKIIEAGIKATEAELAG